MKKIIYGVGFKESKTKNKVDNTGNLLKQLLILLLIVLIPYLTGGIIYGFENNSIALWIMGFLYLFLGILAYIILTSKKN